MHVREVFEGVPRKVADARRTQKRRAAVDRRSRRSAFRRRLCCFSVDCRQTVLLQIACHRTGRATAEKLKDLNDEIPF
jgi:hypothetical protein